MSAVAHLVVWTGRLPGPTYEPTGEGSPGFAGFVATFLLAAALVVLGVSFTRRMRRATHRERLREREAEQHAAGAGVDPAGAAGEAAATDAPDASPEAGPTVADPPGGTDAADEGGPDRPGPQA